MSPHARFEVAFDQGVELRPAGLWLDALVPRDFCFVSEGLEDVRPLHRRVLLTERSAKLGRWGEADGSPPPLVCPFRRVFALGELRVELLPAGSLPGSAQLLLDGPYGSLLYAGALNLAGTANGERPARATAQTLVVDASHTPGAVRAPTRDESRTALLALVNESLRQGITPVLVAEALAVAPELLRILGDAGHKSRVHGAIYGYCRLFQSFGIELRGAMRFKGTPAHDEVVVVPPQHAAARAIRSLHRAQTVHVVSLRALQRDARIEDALVQPPASGGPRRLVLAMRSDEAAIVAYAQELAPERIYAAGANAQSLAAALRAAGLVATALAMPEQLSLL